MRHLSRSLIVVLMILATVISCRQSSPPAEPTGLTMTLEVEPAAAEVGPATLTVTLADDVGAPVDGATVTVRGDMSHAGMQPVEAIAGDARNGVYRADLEWSMAGDWIVTVTATLPDGRMAMQEFPLSVASP